MLHLEQDLPIPDFELNVRGTVRLVEREDIQTGWTKTGNGYMRLNVDGYALALWMDNVWVELDSQSYDCRRFRARKNEPRTVQSRQSWQRFSQTQAQRARGKSIAKRVRDFEKQAARLERTLEPQWSHVIPDKKRKQLWHSAVQNCKCAIEQGFATTEPSPKQVQGLAQNFGISIVEYLAQPHQILRQMFRTLNQ